MSSIQSTQSRIHRKTGRSSTTVAAILPNNTAQYYNLSLLVQEQERFLLTARLILGVASRTF